LLAQQGTAKKKAITVPAWSLLAPAANGTELACDDWPDGFAEFAADELR
jgi:hypothetical protein